MHPKACFVAGTAIAAAAGYVAIETLKPGDLVWAWDEETGDVALKPVKQLFINESDELIHLTVNGEEITTTPTHPFYVAHKGWYAAVDLRAGDILVLVNGEYVTLEKTQHEILEAPITVYNFEVEDYHTYYVGTDGVLVHNSCGDSLDTISTGRTKPNNLQEKLAMESAKSNPSAGKIIIKKLKDPRIPAGYSKYQQSFQTSRGKIVIHYVGNAVKNHYFDFKYK